MDNTRAFTLVFPLTGTRAPVAPAPGSSEELSGK